MNKYSYNPLQDNKINIKFSPKKHSSFLITSTKPIDISTGRFDNSIFTYGFHRQPFL